MREASNMKSVQNRYLAKEVQTGLRKLNGIEKREDKK